MASSFRALDAGETDIHQEGATSLRVLSVGIRDLVMKLEARTKRSSGGFLRPQWIRWLSMFM